MQYISSFKQRTASAKLTLLGKDDQFGEKQVSKLPRINALYLWTSQSGCQVLTHGKCTKLVIFFRRKIILI